MSQNVARMAKERKLLHDHYYRGSRAGSHTPDFQFFQANLVRRLAKNPQLYLVIAGKEADPNDFYVLPYWLVQPLLTDDTLNQYYAGKHPRWTVTITPDRRLTVRGGSREVEPVDVGLFHGVPLWLLGVDNSAIDDDTLQAIEARRAEAEQLRREAKIRPPGLPDKVWRAIRVRQGQADFRRQVLDAYGRTCAITGCIATEVLEAAHIRGYAEDGCQDVTNGLLLRADVHTLFDLGLIAVHPETGVVAVALVLQNTEYAALAGRCVSWPANPAHRPDPSALLVRWDQFASDSAVL